MTAETFAIRLRFNAFAGIGLVGAVFFGLPVFVSFQSSASLILWPALALAAAAALALSVYLLFDAMLFRLIASHESEAAGGKAVDDFLAKSGLRKAPDANRTLAARMAGTMRLLRFQRAALLVFLALFVFMAAGDFS